MFCTLIERPRSRRRLARPEALIELDSYTFHGTRQSFEDDRRKDRRLTAAGWTVIRVTSRGLDDPGRLERELRALGL